MTAPHTTNKPTNHATPGSVIVLDSGGCTCKLGLAHTDPTPKCFPNCTAKIKGEKHILVGESILKSRDISSLTLRRPVDRGYVVNWDLQRDIWARSLKKLLGPNTPPSSVGLVVTEPYMNLPALREGAMRTVLEELGVGSVVMLPAAVLALRWHAAQQQPNAQENDNLSNQAGCGLIVDAGFSYTHAVPVFDWKVLPVGVRRVDLGGKALGNYLRELVSYRSINLMDETLLIERIKEELCFVSMDIHTDLAAAKKRMSVHRREYLLPDGVTDTWGHIRTEEEMFASQRAAAAAAAAGPGARNGMLPKEAVLVVNNERFMVPEALFHPTDIGMEEAGIAEAISQAVASVHPHLRGLLYKNVVVIGGTARLPGFVERLTSELRPLVPDDYDLNVTMVEGDPREAAWKGGALLGQSGALYGQLAVTKAEWRAHGMAACQKWER